MVRTCIVLSYIIKSIQMDLAEIACNMVPLYCTCEKRVSHFNSTELSYLHLNDHALTSLSELFHIYPMRMHCYCL